MRYIFLMILCASTVTSIACSSEDPKTAKDLDASEATDTPPDGGLLRDGDIDLRDGERAPFDADCLFCGEPI